MPRRVMCSPVVSIRCTELLCENFSSVCPVRPVDISALLVLLLPAEIYETQHNSTSFCEWKGAKELEVSKIPKHSRERAMNGTIPRFSRNAHLSSGSWLGGILLLMLQKSAYLSNDPLAILLVLCGMVSSRDPKSKVVNVTSYVWG